MSRISMSRLNMTLMSHLQDTESRDITSLGIIIDALECAYFSAINDVQNSVGETFSNSNVFDDNGVNI